MRHRLALPIMIIALTCSGSIAAAQGTGGRGQGQGQGQGQGRFSPARLMENDADGDGRLSRDELPGRMADRLFDRADTNGDGYLDKAELEAFFASRGGGRRVGGGAGGGAGEGQGRGGGFGQRRPGVGRANFETHMGTLGRSMRRLSRSELDASTLEEDLRSVSAIQAAFIGAKNTLGNVTWSEHAKEKFGTDQAAYQRAFRLHLLSGLAESLALERALLESDANAVRASMKKLVAIRDEGHDRYQHDEENEEDQEGDAGTAAGKKGTGAAGGSGRGRGRDAGGGTRGGAGGGGSQG